MPEETIQIGFETKRSFYRNASVSKVHEDGVYDIKFSTGKIKTFVENVSSLSFNSGDYVAVIVSRHGNEEVYKIMGKGRKIRESGNIEIVRV